MAWTNPTSRAAGELVTASIWNTDVIDNLTYLKTRPSDLYKINEGADYTITGSTTYADVDATDLELSITTNGGDVLVSFYGTIAISGASTPEQLCFDFTIDGTREGGDDGLVAFRETADGVPKSISFSYLKTGLSAAAHLFKLQWKIGHASDTGTLYAGAGTANADFHPMFFVKEI